MFSTRRGARAYSNAALANSLRVVTNILQSKAPLLPLKAVSCAVLHTPTDFYNEILKQISQAQQRICFSSLYLGTGEQEKRLVTALKDKVEAKRAGGEKFSVNILLDANRARRKDGTGDSSVSLLSDLVLNHPETVQLSLFHPPDLRGIYSRAPPRWNELLSVQHTKILVCDDSVIFTGANLSKDYFTNRQDRYLLVNNEREVADWYVSLHRVLCDLSFNWQVKNGNEVLTPRLPAFQPIESPKPVIRETARSLILPLVEPRTGTAAATAASETFLAPLVQMAPLGVTHESHVLTEMMERAPAGSLVRLASGYFNFTPEYTSALFGSKAKVELVLASPEANGFFNAKGSSRHIPGAYSFLEGSLRQQLAAAGRAKHVTLLEHTRPGWTYHAKGLWMVPEGETEPFLTVIGSSNFGYRSKLRDIEAQAVIVTRDAGLRRQLSDECANLKQHTVVVTDEVMAQPSHQFAWWIPAATRVLRSFL